MTKTPSLRIDAGRNEVFYNGKPVHLTFKEYRLLTLLMKSGNILSRPTLLKDIWGSDEIDSRTVDQHIARLRRKLWREVVITVSNCGYKIQRGAASFFSPSRAH